MGVAGGGSRNLSSVYILYPECNSLVQNVLCRRLWEEKKKWLRQGLNPWLGRQRLIQLGYKKCSTTYYDHGMAST